MSEDVLLLDVTAGVATVTLNRPQAANGNDLGQSNGVGSALNAEQVEAFDAGLASLLAGEFPGELHVPHRIFATSGIAP